MTRRSSASRRTCTFAALDEVRHTQIPLLLMHELIRWDPQFDWTHKFYHSNNWVAIAARHLGVDANDAEVARAWPRWYAANRDVIGPDPDLLHPGMVLAIPGSRTAVTR